MFTSLLGYAMATIGAGLGGHLVYGENQGVNHAVAENLPTQWIRLLPMDELMDGKPHRAKVKERDIVLVRHSGAIHALLDSCSHLGGPLHKGTVDDCSITCPWHGSRFALVDGHVLNGPATLNQPTFESRIIDGYVEVRAFSAEAP
jgi:nitrite reductase/ring-hydroxylating ferredoxin subunit